MWATLKYNRHFYHRTIWRFIFFPGICGKTSIDKVIEDLLQVGRNKVVTSSLTVVAKAVEQPTENTSQIPSITTANNSEEHGSPSETLNATSPTTKQEEYEMSVQKARRVNEEVAAEVEDEEDEDVPLTIEEKPQSPYQCKPSPPGW